jgi:hypothetical protein
MPGHLIWLRTGNIANIVAVELGHPVVEALLGWDEFVFQHLFIIEVNVYMIDEVGCDDSQI